MSEKTENKVKILDVAFDFVTIDGAVSRIMGFLKENKNHVVVTPNPEIVMMAQKDHELKSIIQNADLVVADGIGIVWASKYKKTHLPERVSGYDLVMRLFEQISKSKNSVYLLGGAPGVAQMAADKIREKYPGLNIIGCHHGFFNEESEKKIIQRINELKPDILLVGLGAPKQEKWIAKNKLSTKISIGVGGSLDVMSGKLTRAPILFQKLGLEWFYRLLKQPSRAKRMLVLPRYILCCLTDRN